MLLLEECELARKKIFVAGGISPRQRDGRGLRCNPRTLESEDQISGKAHYSRIRLLSNSCTSTEVICHEMIG
jgi:hypothetical protein